MRLQTSVHLKRYGRPAARREGAGRSPDPGDFLLARGFGGEHFEQPRRADGEDPPVVANCFAASVTCPLAMHGNAEPEAVVIATNQRAAPE